MRAFRAPAPEGVPWIYTLPLGLTRFLSLLWCCVKDAGRGPTKAKTLINKDAVTVLLADTLTKGERTLVEHGRSDRVLQVRHDYQLAMRDDLVGIVERQLDRRVIAFMSQSHIDPDLAAEVFVLEPASVA